MKESYLGYDFKIVFVGNSGVGKTSVIQKYLNNEFPSTHIPSLSSEFYEINYNLENTQESVHLFLWDTPGLEKYHFLSEDVFEEVNIFVLFYSVEDRSSFESIPEWLEKVKMYSPNTEVILVENKTDLIENSLIKVEESTRMSKQLNAPLFRISVPETLNLQTLFRYISIKVQNKYLSTLNMLPNESNLFFVHDIDEEIEEYLNNDNNETSNNNCLIY